MPDEHALAFQNLLSVIENYACNGAYTLVIDGLFSDGSGSDMEKIIEIFQRHDCQLHCFVLSASRELLWERNCQRDHVVPRDEFDQLYDYVMRSNGTSALEHIIDISQSIEDCLALLRAH